MRLILASQSIGRKDLLSHLNIPFEIIPSRLDEDKIIGNTPLETLKLRAKLKGEEVLSKIKKSNFKFQKYKPSSNHQPPTTNDQLIILSADSGAILNNQLIGKPKDYRDAVKILQTLSGRKHKFITAVYIIKMANSQVPILKTDLNVKTPNPKKRFSFAKKHQILNKHVVSEKFGIKSLPAKDKKAMSEKIDIEALSALKIWQTFDRSFVTFRKLTNDDIKLYLKNTNYTRFAGGYSLFNCPKCRQPRMKDILSNVPYIELIGGVYIPGHTHGLDTPPQDFITDIKGSISNVIGMPMEKLIPLLSPHLQPKTKNP
ncbi:Maf family protein [Patescibacteria group bacterium]|nr:Maf family protein [Patescibacteria group bacterium]MCL5797858.1 Maf family protein [Patescibacteria group bacterium]